MNKKRMIYGIALLMVIGFASAITLEQYLAIDFQTKDLNVNKVGIATKQDALTNQTIGYTYTVTHDDLDQDLNLTTKTLTYNIGDNEIRGYRQCRTEQTIEYCKNETKQKMKEYFQYKIQQYRNKKEAEQTTILTQQQAINELQDLDIGTI